MNVQGVTEGLSKILEYCTRKCEIKLQTALLPFYAFGRINETPDCGLNLIIGKAVMWLY